MDLLDLREGRETSPHAWSRHGSSRCPLQSDRNISTCVEQTVEGTFVLSTKTETSPHAWSRPSLFVAKCLMDRNISTCVEQTAYRSPYQPPVRKHLHMRGADFLSLSSIVTVVETSPHAWSRLLVSFFHRDCGGNISTCVEQTATSSSTAFYIAPYIVVLILANFVKDQWKSVNGPYIV